MCPTAETNQTEISLLTIDPLVDLYLQLGVFKSAFKGDPMEVLTRLLKKKRFNPNQFNPNNKNQEFLSAT
jgi:hypothetical protein